MSRFLEIPTEGGSIQYSLDERADLYWQNTLSSLRGHDCQICFRDVLWAPSPNVAAINTTLYELKRGGCRACQVLCEGVIFFASFFQSPLNLSAVCVSFTLAEGFDQNMTVNIEFKDRADMQPISVRFSTVLSPTSPQAVTRKYQDSNSINCVELIKEWVSKCEKHSQCDVVSTFLPSRVVEVGSKDIRLLESQDQRGQYLALSHCWGQSPALTTTRDTLERRKKCIEYDELGKTFQDAVVLTRRLGFSYLWIDSLCIIQDSQSDWEQVSANMASVFKNAYITIAASRAASGEIGCFSELQSTPYIWYSRDIDAVETIREPTVEYISHPQLWKPHRLLYPAPSGASSTMNEYFWMALQPSHSMPTHGKGLGNIVKIGFPLFSRAWALQERVLSPRIIHFGPMELFWECREGMFCECHTDDSRKPRERSAQDIYSNLLKGHETPNYSWTWQALVEECSRLRLTKEQDRLPALSGIAKSNPSKYLAGIWKEHIPNDLYWTVCALPTAPARRPSQYRAPSFSWASVDAPILYHRWRPKFELDEDLHQSFRQGHVVSTILEASCAVDGLDQHGRVKDGHINFNGWTGSAVVGRVYNNDTSTICELNKGNQSHRFTLDIPLDERQSIHRMQDLQQCDSIGSEVPAEVQPNERVMLLLLECEKILQGPYKDSIGHYRVAALVLKPSSRIRDAYERVGLIFPAYQARFVNSNDEHHELLVGDIFRSAPDWFDKKIDICVV